MSATKDYIYKALSYVGDRGYDGVSNGSSRSYNALEGAGIPKTQLPHIYSLLMRQKLTSLSTNPDGSTTLQLTPNGAHRLLRERMNRLTVHTPDKWDSHWRLISFKLPTSKDSERLLLYRRLKELNIHMVKRGLWVYPYDCFEVVQQIATYCNLSRYMIYAEVLRFDGKTESELRRHYDLLK